MQRAWIVKRSALFGELSMVLLNKSRTGPTGLVITVLALSGSIVSLMQTLIVPLLPDLPHLLHISADAASWSITVTLLTSAVATPSVSKLADMVGKRRMMLISLAVMVAGSILGALGSGFAEFLVARAMQGVAMALIPIGMSIMRDELPQDRLGSAVALMSASMGIGAVVGLPLAGVIYGYFGWHAVFWVSAVMGLFMMMAVRVVIPESGVRTGGRFDLLGAILFAGALAALLLAITNGGSWGWSSHLTMLMLLLSIVSIALWIPWELRVGQPLVDLRTTIYRPVLITNIASVFVGFSMFANMLSAIQLLQLPKATGYGFGLDVIRAGLALLPAGLAMVVLSPVSAGITNRFGAKITLIVGSLVLAFGYFGRILFISHVWEIILGSIVVSAGTAIAYAAMPTLIMRSVPITETTAANGLNTVIRGVGTSTSSAVVAAILTNVTFNIGGVDLPRKFAFQEVFIFASLAALAGAAIAVALPRHRKSVDVELSEDPEAIKGAGREHEIVVHGIIMDGDDHPLRHALVSVLRLDGEAIDWSRADNQGVFSLAVPGPSDYLIVVTAKGWAPDAEVVNFNIPSELTRLKLKRNIDQSLHLRVEN